jgi:hypothetical protein
MTRKHEMDPRHGFGFLLFGFFMWLLPAMAPDWFPAPSYGGMDGRAMWLEGMGIIQILFGGTLILRYWAAPALARWAAESKAAAPVPAFGPGGARQPGRAGGPVRANLPAALRSA